MRKKRLCSHNKSRRAVAALLRIVVDKSRDNRVTPATVRAEAFDGFNFSTLRVDGQYSAGIDGLAIHDDRTGATGSPVTDAFGACKVQMVAQCIEQGYSRLHF